MFKLSVAVQVLYFSVAQYLPKKENGHYFIRFNNVLIFCIRHSTIKVVVNKIILNNKIDSRLPFLFFILRTLDVK